MKGECIIYVVICRYFPIDHNIVIFYFTDSIKYFVCPVQTILSGNDKTKILFIPAKTQKLLKHFNCIAISAFIIPSLLVFAKNLSSNLN